MLPVLVVMLVGTSAANDISPNDLRPRPYAPTQVMESSQRIKLIELLEKSSAQYLAALETVSWKSFSAVQASPEIVASLVNEVEDTKTLMRQFHTYLQALKEDPGNSGQWLLLLRSYYLIAPYCEDLDERDIVGSDEYIGIRMLLPAVFDRILIPDAL